MAEDTDCCDGFMGGVLAIGIERRRQVEQEEWTAEHDDDHSSGELAEAAICYAATARPYYRKEFAAGVSFVDPWPWDYGGDKRFGYGERRDDGGNWPPDPATYTPAERRDLLVKAGALIAAEIDRLDRLGKAAEAPE